MYRNRDTNMDASVTELASVPVWLLLGFVIILLGRGIAPADTSLAAMGYLQVAFGIWVFWTHGGRQITAAGVYSLSSSIFVGFAAIWYADLYGEDLPPALRTATALCYFSHVAMYALFWRKSFILPNPEITHGAPEPLTKWLAQLGAAFLVGATAIRLFTVGIVFVDSAAFVGIGLLAVAWMVHTGAPSRGRWYLLGSLAGAVVYATVFFIGYGRLQLATLGIVLAAVAARRFKHRVVKLTLVLSIPGALFVFGAMRVAFMQELFPGAADTGAGTENGGIDSVINPLLTFSMVIHGIQSGSFGYGYGQSFLATALLYVPRALWPEKPLGFGAVLTRLLLKPGTYAETGPAGGNSLAALTQGEWFHNFGVAGIALMVIVLGPIVRWLDGVFQRLLSRPLASRTDVIALTCLALTVGGMSDLVWVGTFTFNQRSGSRLILLLVVTLICTDVLWRRLRGSPSGEIQRGTALVTRRSSAVRQSERPSLE
jgi:hypothetical protein